MIWRMHSKLNYESISLPIWEYMYNIYSLGVGVSKGTSTYIYIIWTGTVQHINTYVDNSVEEENDRDGTHGEE